MTLVHSQMKSKFVHVTRFMQVMRSQAHQLGYSEKADAVVHQEIEAPQDCLIIMPQAHKNTALCCVNSTKSLVCCWQLEQTLAQLLQLPHIHALCEECTQLLVNKNSKYAFSIFCDCALSCAPRSVRWLGQVRCSLGNFLVTEDVVAAQGALHMRRSCSKVLARVHEAFAATTAGAPVSPYLHMIVIVTILQSKCDLPETIKPTIKRTTQHIRYVAFLHAISCASLNTGLNAAIETVGA